MCACVCLVNKSNCSTGFLFICCSCSVNALPFQGQTKIAPSYKDSFKVSHLTVHDCTVAYSHALHQPRSQGLSPPAPQSESRETLAQAGHVPFGESKTLGRGPLTSSILSRCTLLISKRGDHTRSDRHYVQCYIAVSHSY